MIPRPIQGSLLPASVPDRPVGPLIGSVIAGSNADLIAAVAPLYLAGSVVDVTYGSGAFWRRFVPDPFTIHDAYTLDGVDYRRLPEAAGTYDAAVFDPPYIPQGGTGDDGTAASFRDRYGLTETTNRDALEADLRAGIAECLRVTRPGGYVLVKCCDYTHASMLNLGHVTVIGAALELGAHVHDLIVHASGGGPGAPHRTTRQIRARRTHSYLVVLRPRKVRA